MGKHAQIVMGPAGSGKSTYCNTMQQHCATVKRTVHVVNLDPAAEEFSYPVSVDIRDLVTLEDVMDELGYGPNGGLVYCMEYLIQNLDWLRDELEDFQDDYLIFDCPGQIELYTHIPVMRVLVDELQRLGYQVCGVFLLDSHFIDDTAKFISGSLLCLSAMVALEIPHINVLTKCDLLSKKKKRDEFLEDYLIPNGRTLLSKLNEDYGPRYHHLNEAISTLVTEYSLVSLTPLDNTDEDSIAYVLNLVDTAIQYGEDLEPVEPPTVDVDV